MINKFVSLIIIVILLPIIVIIFLLLLLFNKSNPIFFSKRIGYNNKVFKMPKFRTMILNTPDLATHKLENNKLYITKIGSILRKTSLDEIPQLFSILNGDMNFIGVRPALFNQYDLIKLRTKHNLHLIKPGITGWAQINGRDGISIEEKVNLEKYYFQNQSFLFDIKIIFLTFINVLTKKGISH